MGAPAAKRGDLITATDTHIVMVPSGSGATPTALPHPFKGTIDGNLSDNVNVMGEPAATVDGTATNTPPHAPTPPGVSFQTPPENKGTIISGSATVRINGRAAARDGDKANTCNDPADLPVGTVVAVGTVRIG